MAKILTPEDAFFDLLTNNPDIQHCPAELIKEAIILDQSDFAKHALKHFYEEKGNLNQFKQSLLHFYKEHGVKMKLSLDSRFFWDSVFTNWKWRERYPKKDLDKDRAVIYFRSAGVTLLQELHYLHDVLQYDTVPHPDKYYVWEFNLYFSMNNCHSFDRLVPVPVKLKKDALDWRSRYEENKRAFLSENNKVLLVKTLKEKIRIDRQLFEATRKTVKEIFKLY